MERCRTGGTLIICDLCCHVLSSFPVSVPDGTSTLLSAVSHPAAQYDRVLRIVQEVQIRRCMVAVSQHDFLQVLCNILTVFAAEIRRLKRGLDAQLPAVPHLLRPVAPQLRRAQLAPICACGKHIFLQTILGDPSPIWYCWI